MFKISIKIKLVAFLLFLFSIIFGLAAYISSKIVKDKTAEAYESDYSDAVNAYIDKTEGILNTGCRLADQLAVQISTSEYLKDLRIDTLLKQILQSDNAIFAAGVAFSPYSFSHAVKNYGPFYYKSNNTLNYLDLGNFQSDYNYTDSVYDWFSVPVSTGRAYWSRPFFSAVLTDYKVVTYSVPFFRNGLVSGVVVIDYSLNDLNRFLVKNLKSKSERYLILDKELNYVSHVDTSRILTASFLTDKKSALSAESRVRLIAEINTAPQGKIILPDSSGRKLIHVFYSGLEINDWVIILYEYEDQLLAVINKIFLISAFSSFGGLVLVLILVFWGTNKALKPLSDVRNFLARIVEGDYNSDLNITTGDEFEDLASDLTLMKNTLKERENELKRINTGLEAIVDERTAELKSALEKNIKLGSAVENSPALISITDIKGFVEYINPVFTRITGISISSSREHTLNIFQTALVGGVSPDFIVGQIQSGGLYQDEILLNFKNEVKYWMQFSVAGIKNEKGILNNLVFLWQDISDIKTAGEQINRSAELLAVQNSLLNSRNKYISDSINYAKLIQDAILPDENELGSVFKEYLLIYSPKDVVSGDFYWYRKTEDYLFFAVIDCTGHGVPGAFMTFIGKLLLNEIVFIERLYAPHEILNRLNARVIEELSGSDDKSFISGMDAALLVFEINTGKIFFSGANRNLLVFRNGIQQELKGITKSVGDKSRTGKIFFSETTDIYQDPVFYLFSDGITDQNNGQNKKFGTRRLKELINFVGGFDLVTQRKLISRALRMHQGDEEQRDDMTFFAVRFEVRERNQTGKKLKFGPSFRSDDLLEIKEKIESEFTGMLIPGSVSKLTFTALELAQNIGHYSSERGDENYAGSGAGYLFVEHKENKLTVTSLNYIDFTAIENLMKKLTEINNSNEETLKKLYKEKLKSDPEEKSKGAGIGLIQIARRTGSKVLPEFFIVNETELILKLKCELSI